MPEARTHQGADRGTDDVANAAVVNLIRAHALVTAQLGELFRRHRLSGPGFNVLMILEGAGEPLSPYEIGERRLVTRGTVTGLLDTLERENLLRRSPHPSDRRMLLVELTDEGRSLVERVRAELFPLQARMMASLSRPEKGTLVRLLRKLQAHLEGGGGVPKPDGSVPE